MILYKKIINIQKLLYNIQTLLLSLHKTNKYAF